MKITGFASIVQQYELVFFDSFGVLKNSNGLIPNIKETFDFLNQKKIDFRVLTNDASRSPEKLAEYFNVKGLHHIISDKILSSGMLAREYLKLKVKKGRVVYLGTPDSAHYIETAGFKTVSIQQLDLSEIDDITALVLLDDEGFHWANDINKVVNLLRRKNIPSVVANTDKAYPISKDEVAIAIGAIADMVEDIVGKKFIRFGKPDTQIFMFAYEQALESNPISRNKILMVGDTLETDIMGGNKFGLDTALVLSGNTLPENANMRIHLTGVIPTYICDNALIN